MKRFFVLAYSASLLLTVSVNGVHAKGFLLQDSLKPETSLNDLSGQNFIFFPDVTIDFPGVYQVGNGLEFDPGADDEFCIRIESDNVVLDLNGQTIFQASGNTQLNIGGISIASGLKNVSIRNGSIADMSGMGIVVDTNVEGLNIYNVTLSNLMSGLQIGSGATTVFLSDLNVNDMANPSGSAFGISCDTASSIAMQNCACSNVVASGDSSGVIFTNCSGLAVQSSLAHDNVGGGAARGIALNACDTALLADCAAYRTTSTSSTSSDVAVGYDLEDSFAVVVENCVAVSTIGTNTAFGFRTVDGGTNQFKGCQAVKNEGDLDGVGFAFDGTENDSILEKCISDGNLAGTGIAYGFFANENVVTCLIRKNTMINNVGATTSFGVFDAAADATTNRYFTNFWMNNTSNINFTSVDVPVYAGTLSGTPGTFENISF